MTDNIFSILFVSSPDLLFVSQSGILIPENKGVEMIDDHDGDKINMQNKSKGIIFIMNFMLTANFFLFIIGGSILLYIFITKPFYQVLLPSLLFIGCSIFLSSKLSAYLYNRRAFMFNQGDPALLVTHGSNPQYCKFDRLIMECEDWMPDDMRAAFSIALSKSNSPVAIITTSDDNTVAIVSTTRLLAVQ